MVDICGSITCWSGIAVNIASIALPPSRNTASAACVTAGCDVETIAFPAVATAFGPCSGCGNPEVSAITHLRRPEPPSRQGGRQERQERTINRRGRGGRREDRVGIEQRRAPQLLSALSFNLCALCDLCG